MPGKFLRDESIRQPQRGRESKQEEYGREYGGIAECPICHNIHFKKRWYTSLSHISKAGANKKEEYKVTREQLCPACMMIKNHLYEGELTIEKVPENIRNDLSNLMYRYGNEATEKDPQDRIIEIRVTKDGYRVTTTENQLANRLAKKIRDAFKKVEVYFSHSSEPFEVNRARVVFEERK